MKKITILLFLSLLISCNTKTTEEEKKEIVNLFDEFNTANIELNGEKLYQLSDEASHQYYVDLLEKTKTLDSLGVDKLNLGDKINLLSIRSMLSDSRIKEITAKELMVTMYTEINTMDDEKINSIKSMQIMDIKINNDVAIGNLGVGQNVILPKVDIKFSKEEGDWKFNIISMSDFANQQLITLCQENEITEMDFVQIIFLMPEIQNRALKSYNDIWSPIN
jgi:hypothetical protein